MNLRYQTDLSIELQLESIRPEHHAIKAGRVSGQESCNLFFASLQYLQMLIMMS